MASVSQLASCSTHTNQLGVPVEQSLEAALEDVEHCFDGVSIRGKRINAEEVLRYYRQSDRVYRRYHSHEGALHVGLVPPGVVRPVQHGHTRQAELFESVVKEINGTRSIEFGCGNGYNLRLLAQWHPAWHLTGIDLSENHIRTARQLTAGLENIRLIAGSYLKLPEADASFDAVLAIETLCQCDSQETALREAFRTLRPRGRIMVLDCFRDKQQLANASPPLARAAVLVEKTAAVDSFAEINQWKQLARRVGFVEVECVDRSSETAHDLSRLYRMARRYFKLPSAVRLLSRRVAPRALQNVICGLLMPYTVGEGVHRYYSVVLEKPGTHADG